MIGLDKSKNKPTKKDRYKLAVNCDDRRCSYQCNGECRAYRVDVKSGVVDCPREDLERTMTKVPRYGERRRGR